jgi:hypothetical protein
LNGTYATTGSNTFTGIQTINSNLTVTGSITAQTLIVSTINATQSYSSGSNIFGNSLGNTQQFTGSVSVTGSLTSNGALSGTSATFTGTALLGGASATNPLSIRTADGESYIRFLNANGTTYGDLERSITGAGAVRFTGANFRFTAGAEVVGALTGSIATFSSTVAINGSTSVDSLTVSRNADNNSGGLTLFNANTSGYGSALTFRINYAGVYNTSRIHGDWDTGNSGNLYFYTANTSQSLVERMRINGLGNVGIGTTSPVGAESNDLVLQINGNSTAAMRSMLRFTNGNSGTTWGNGVFMTLDSSLDFYFYNLENAATIFGTNGTERMRITSGGNVEIKSAGELRVYRADNARYGTFYTDNSAVHIAASVDPIRISTPERLEVYTAGTERMRITSDGYLKASNTGAYLSSGEPYHEFSSNRVNYPALLVWANSGDFGDQAFSIYTNRNTTNNTYYAISYYNVPAAAYKFRVADSGNVTNTNNSYGAISDIKLKENIVDATSKLDDLLKVKVKNFNFIGSEEKQIGVIAQELEEIFPGLVSESEDFEEVEITDEEGNITKEKQSLGTTTKSVKYSIFVPMLIKAMQEQQTQIESLKSENDTLKSILQRNNIS